MELDRAQLIGNPWPQDSLPHGAFATVDALLAEGSRVVLSPMEANEPVLLAKLSGPNGRATLSNLLTPGMRAVTIKTDEIAGVGGFITPGDRVDIVLTRDAGAIDEGQEECKRRRRLDDRDRGRGRECQGADGRAGADERQTTPQSRRLGNDRSDGRRAPEDCARTQHRHAVAVTARLRRGQFRQGRADDDLVFRGIGFGGCGEAAGSAMDDE